MIEESGMAKIPLIRKGGNYGQVTVKFSVQNSTAMEGLDYVVPKREVVLADGDRNATIDIVIRDDNIMEFEERFIIRLVEILGKNSYYIGLNKNARFSTFLYNKIYRKPFAV